MSHQVSKAPPNPSAPSKPAAAKIAAVRASLPDGTIPVAAALLIAGVATYGFLIIGQKGVGSKEAFKPLQALWFATFALVPGFFLPLEQELGRAISHRRAIGQGGRPVVVKVARLGLLLGGAVAIAVLAASPFISTHYFEGDWILVVALVLALVGYLPAHLARGICSGSGRFRPYAIVMGSDGVVRMAICVALFGLGVTSLGPYAFAIALSPLVGLAYVARKGGLAIEPGPEASWREVTPNLGWLLMGSVFAAMLLNAGPVLTNLLADDGEVWDDRVTGFGNGVLLARVPLFMFQAVQAALLPRLSRLAASGNFTEFRSGLKRLLFLVITVGLLGTVGALALGPFVLKRVFDTELAGSTLALLALGSACYMMAIALAQAVIALKGHMLVGLGWVVGVVTLALSVWLSSDDVFRRVEIGLLVSSVCAAIWFALALRVRLRSGARPDDQSVLEAFTDMPFEA